MRVLVVDQDSTMNEAIARSLPGRYTVDAVTTKGDCLDLLRSNAFEVIVAGERLEDGSGLELLGQISKKWPAVLRIFAADRHRLKLLKGRLGPFELFQTLAYPIDPERLLATLTLAEAAQGANADTSNIQHVELTSEIETEEAEVPDAFPAPEPEPREPQREFPGSGTARPRSSRGNAGPAQPQRAPQMQRQAEPQRGPPPQTEGSAASAQPQRSAPAQPQRSASAQPQRSASAQPQRSPSAQPQREASQQPQRAAAPQRTASGQRPRRNGAAGGPSIHPVGSSAPAGAGAPAGARNGRSRSGSNRPPPVRFPPLEPPQDTAVQASALRPTQQGTDSFAETAAMARSARSNLEPLPDEMDSKRIAILIGGGVAVALVVVVLGFKLFGSKTDPAAHPAAPVAHAPQYPQQVTDLVAQIESAFKSDDFNGARADVDKLRQISPSHPRLAFFENLLAHGDNGSKTASSDATRGGTPGRADHSAQAAPRRGSAATNSRTAINSQSVGGSHDAGSASGADGSHVTASTPDAELLPETPPGMSLAPSTMTSAQQAAPTQPQAPSPAPASQPVPVPEPVVAAAPSSPTPSVAAQAASPVTAPASAPAPHRAPSGEPPPVVQEAKLIRRVNPDYPSAAKKDGIEGTVDLAVTVSKQGAVTDVSVARATPADVFDKAAIAAVRKWKYDPLFVDGLATEAHLQVHLDFRPGQ